MGNSRRGRRPGTCSESGVEVGETSLRRDIFAAEQTGFFVGLRLVVDAEDGRGDIIWFISLRLVVTLVTRFGSRLEFSVECPDLGLQALDGLVVHP